MGQARAPARRDRRQGRVLRQRRARPQACRRHAADEEGHGRRGPRARARPPDHRGAAAGPAAPAHPGGRECGVGRRLPARRHRQVPQRDIRRDRQYRRRRPPDPRRRADQGSRGQARADRRFRDSDRRRARRARPRPPAPSSPTRTILPLRLEQAAREVEDPLWRMPLWDPYDEMLKSDDRRFRQCRPTRRWPAASPPRCSSSASFRTELPWAHLDTYAWRDRARPGRPKGGDALGLRAVFAMLERRYSQAPEPAIRRKSRTFSSHAHCNISRALPV